MLVAHEAFRGQVELVELLSDDRLDHFEVDADTRARSGSEDRRFSARAPQAPAPESRERSAPTALLREKMEAAGIEPAQDSSRQPSALPPGTGQPSRACLQDPLNPLAA